MSTKVIAISLPAELIEAIDRGAKAIYATRSDFIRQTLLARLKADGHLDTQIAERVKREHLAQYLRNWIEQYPDTEA